MGATVRFTPLYGARSESRAHAYLLQVDDFNILLDCGWHPSLDPALVEPVLRRVLPSIHAVLLTHPHLTHLGALPAAAAHWGLPADTPVYSTLPVWRMGQMFLYDAYQTTAAARPFASFDLDDVDAAFEARGPAARFHLLKFNQSCPLPAGITITPHPAGHTLGGAVWCIEKDADQIVYALDLNHRRENTLNPNDLRAMPRPSHLVLGAANAATRTRTLRTAQLLDPIIAAVRAGGDVLIPVDTAARVVELAVELNDAWAAAPRGGPLARVPLLVAHEFAGRTLDFARTMIEFMSDRVVKRFDTTRENPFDFKHLRACTHRAAVDALPSPKVVLAAPADLDTGLAQALFLDWAARPECAVILVGRPEPGTLAARLAPHAEDGGGGGGGGGDGGGGRGEAVAAAAKPRCPPFSVPVTVRRREQLSGKALRMWLEEREAEAATVRKRERAEAEASMIAAAQQTAAQQQQAAQDADAAARATAEDTAAAAAVAAKDAADAEAAAAAASKSTPSGDGDRESSSSEDEDDDDDYDTDLIMGVSAAARSGGRPQLLSAQHSRDPVFAASAGASVRAATSHHGVSTTPHSVARPPLTGGGYPIGDSGMVDAARPDGGGAFGVGAAPGLGSPATGFAASRDSGLTVIGSSPSPAGREMVMDMRRVDAQFGRGATAGGKGNWDDYGQAVGVTRFAIGEDPDEEMQSAAATRPGIGVPTALPIGIGTSPPQPLQPPLPGNVGSNDAAPDAEDIPMEYTVREVDLRVACRLITVDRSGLSEGDALKYLVKELEPRRVILVNGTEDETDHLQHYLSNALSASTQPQPGSGRALSSSDRLKAKFESLNDSGECAPGARGENAMDVDGRANDRKLKMEKPKDLKPDVAKSIVVAPKCGEEVDVTSRTSVHQLTLDKGVLDKLQWKRIGASSIAYMDGSVCIPDGGTSEDAVVIPVGLSQRGSLTMLGDGLVAFCGGGANGDGSMLPAFATAGNKQTPDGGALPASDTVGGTGVDAMDLSVIPADACDELLTVPVAHPTVFVGTIMLSRLKDAMIRAGIKAELSEGILCVQNHDTGAVVLVKKVGVQNLVIEGALSEEYYAVRDVLYNELVVVSASVPT